MSKYSGLGLSAVFMAMWCLVGSADPNIRFGLWESTVSMETQGMAMPPVTSQYCLTKESLTPPQTGQQCSQVKKNVSGNTVNWEVTCAMPGGGGDMHGRGRITYQGDTYEGEMKMTMGMGGSTPVQMVQKMRGRRIGDCKK